MNKQRYQIRQGWKNAEGKWLSVLGPTPVDYRIWFCVVDTHYDAPDWNDGEVFESRSAPACVHFCHKLNEEAEAIKK